MHRTAIATNLCRRLDQPGRVKRHLCGGRSVLRQYDNDRWGRADQGQQQGLLR